MVKPYPFTVEQEIWLRDLETTDAPQTIGYLHVLDVDDCNDDISPGFCCLGRACAALGETPDSDHRVVMSYGGRSQDLPDRVWKRLHLRGSDGVFEHIEHIAGTCYGSLAELSDNGLPFKDIAAHIRQNPWTVFTDPAGDAELSQQQVTA